MTKELAAQGKMVIVDNSSIIKHYVYYAELKALSVGLKDGSVYRYRDVDQRTFDALEDAESKGSFFARYIRGKFETETDPQTSPDTTTWPFPTGPKPENQPADHYEELLEWSGEEEEEFFKMIAKDRPQV